MTLLNTLNEAVNIPEAAYIKFLQQYKFTDKTLHFFFEGLEDQSFYVNFIKAVFPKDYIFHFYVCNGKDKVFTNYKDINWTTYNKSRVLFFTDKDLDDILEKTKPVDDNIFATQYYSIENYLVCSDVYDRFLRELCFITDDEVIEDLKQSFIDELEVFTKKMLSISAWVVYCRKNNFLVELDDFNISNIFTISKDFKVKRKVHKEYKTPFEYICTSTKTKHYDFKEIKDILQKLKLIKPAKKYLRGKYELWFLYAFCENAIKIKIPILNEEIKRYNAQNPVKKTKCKVTISIKPENIFQILAPRLSMPEDISNFLEKHLNNIKSLTY
ncbi:DUF4435 domain-containing protein [Cytophagaceae bacterium DM2B3-1]|uniref:DUF4435 domain-containing protein n=1 Tax=Xanthocytophaga flava TaxID=3048013 RepID=A0ABT7CQC4_9BACT|nr:DUF4435 domain-containing protein [Xanthocytophaga flavus]MDJ1495155.1 DUF4435 domain-containing protein [Xanthocytophaga flavus]